VDRHPLLAFALRRALFGAALVLVSASAGLVLARLAPGDVTTELRLEGATGESLRAARERYGLDRPLGEQYVDWLRRAVRLDFGVSFRYGRPVGPLVLERAANTAVLAVAALALAICLGIPLGVVSGSQPDGLVGRVIRAGSVVALSLPPMILSLLLAALAARTGWFPIGGMRGAGADLGLAARLADEAWHLVLPVVALAVPVAALLERLQARALAETLRDPCLAAARARGVPDRRLHGVHALRLALTPVLSLIGLVAGGLLSGSLAVELIVAWPGLGRLMYEALVSRDLPLVAGCAAMAAALVALATFVSDVATAWNDPRVREAP
jgi:peptide/nickel transport system permease protein